MLLQAILVSQDIGSAALISSAFRGAVVDIRHVRNSEEALQAITQSKFDAVIVDYESVPESISILQAMRRSKSNQRAIAFAIVPSNASAKEVFGQGVNFILTRPVTAEVVTAALRAAHGLIVSERRRYLRHSIDSSCWVKSDHGEFQLGLLNVSEGGIGADMSELTAKSLTGQLRFRFFLPESAVPIDGKAELAWYRDGHAGFRFTTLASTSKDELSKWLSRRFDVAAAEAVGKSVRSAAVSVS
jgi:ActR/RegA family two-component response regulator